MFKYFLLLACLLGAVLCNLSLNLEDAGDGYVTFSVGNEGVMPVRFLSYGTPFEGPFSSAFFVYSADRDIPVEYIGPKGRYIFPPAETAYINLLPNNVLSVNVDLVSLYNITEAGEYYVKLALMDYDMDFEETEYPETLSISISRTTPDMTTFFGSLQTVGGDTTNCDSGEISQINTAKSGAITNSANAESCMGRSTCGSLISTWFGDISATNTNYVTSMFDTINKKFSTNTPNYYCNPAGCGNNVYAYVYPTDPTMTIYLCGAFWSTNNAERVNTLVHEESHFNAVGGTNDYAYGRSACKSLANSNSNQACHNADNVCYFADDA